jgi:hypothetical protein
MTFQITPEARLWKTFCSEERRGPYNRDSGKWSNDLEELKRDAAAGVIRAQSMVNDFIVWRLTKG